MKAPIALALDAPDLDTACDWALKVSPFVSTLKIGLETYLRDGKSAISKIKTNTDCEIFLDLKLHDIPATVRGACKSIKDLNPKYLTVHASGGTEMIKVASQEVPETLIVAVTILTSIDQKNLSQIGFKDDPITAAVNLAKLSVAAGARAIVCSPQEVSEIRKSVGGEIILITPGIRPSGIEANDQQRTATPEDAIKAGADLLVIGRPITGAKDIVLAAKTISEQVNRILS